MEQVLLCEKSQDAYTSPDAERRRVYKDKDLECRPAITVATQCRVDLRSRRSAAVDWT